MTTVMDVYQRLAALGLTLPDPPAPIANFENYVQSGRLLFLSGQGPIEVDGTAHRGKVGSEVSAEQAYEHARLTGLS